MAYSEVEIALDALRKMKMSLGREIVIALAEFGEQPCGARLLVEFDDGTDSFKIRFVLVGRFATWRNPIVSRNVFTLKEFCGGYYARKSLSTCLTMEAVDLVMKFEPEILRLTIESGYLKKLARSLRGTTKCIERFQRNFAPKVADFEITNWAAA